MIIRTKLNVPYINSNIVQRKNIIYKLQKIFEYKMTAIIAPAGFGKTTTMASYLLNSNIMHAWISIDENDNDPVRFWKYIIAAASTLVGNPDIFDDILVTDELISSGILAGLIADQLYEVSENAVIVLDDYHLINDITVKKSMAYFLKCLPANITIVVLSRSDINSSFSDLYIRGQILNIGRVDLSFSCEEIFEFFRNKGYVINENQINLMKDYTEGWAAGLVVAAMSLQAGNSITAAKLNSEQNHYIDCFINDEIFNSWPNEVKDFLIQTSLLDKLCEPVCCAVTEKPDAGLILRKLAEGNSLIFRIGSESKWYRYHHLFKEFLEKKLERKGKEYICKLYKLAGIWYEENGLSRDAVAAYIKAGDYTKAFILLVDRDVYIDMAGSGELDEWCRWMYSISEAYPEGYYKEKIQTCCSFSLAMSMKNMPDQAQAWVDKAQTYYDQSGIEDSAEKQYLMAHIAMANATIGIVRMDTHRVIKYFRQAGSLCIYQPILVGELNASESRLLNTIYGFKGHLNKIDKAYKGLNNDITRMIGDFSAYLALLLAECSYERNDIDCAYQIIMQVINPVMELNNSGLIVPCFITLALIKKAEGNVQEAIKTIEAGRKKLCGRNKVFWNYYFDIFTAELFIYLKDIVSAEEWIDTGRISIYDEISCTREYEYIVYAKYLILKKQYDDALLLLKRLEDFEVKEGRLGNQIHILILLAVNYNLKQDSRKAMETFENALNLGMEHGYVRAFIDELEPVSELLVKYRGWKKKSGDTDQAVYARMLLSKVIDYINVFQEKNPGLNTGKFSAAEGLLSPREYKVLKLISAGHSNSEIAQELCITVRTVKHHNSQIFEKLGAKNRVEAVNKARDTGLLN